MDKHVPCHNPSHSAQPFHEGSSVILSGDVELKEGECNMIPAIARVSVVKELERVVSKIERSQKQTRQPSHITLRHVHANLVKTVEEELIKPAAARSRWSVRLGLRAAVVITDSGGIQEKPRS
jgi:hypothetical protein